MSDTLNIETGCYIGSSWGIYTIERLYDLADGMVPDDEKPDNWSSIGQIIHHSLHGDQDETIPTDAGENVSLETAHDIVPELYDELTDLLPTDLDHSWIWHEGELFYWSDDDIDKMGDF